MLSTVTCHCGAHFQLEESTAERRVNCPTCNSVIFLTAPNPEVSSGEGYGLDLAALEGDEPPKPKGRKGSPDWLERYRVSKEGVRGEHSKTFMLLEQLAGASATLNPLGAALYLAVSHSDAETSVAALATVAIAPHPIYSHVARALLEHVGPTDATGAAHLVELLLETTDEGAALTLIHTLERIGPTGIVPVRGLVDLLGSRHERARGWVARCLARIGRPARHAVEPLLKSIKGSTHETKLAILDALGSIGRDPARVVPLLVQALQHPAPDFRLQGAQGLKRFGADAAAALPELKAHLARETDAAVKQACTEAIAAVNAAVSSAGTGPAGNRAAPVVPGSGMLEVTCACGKHLRAKPELAGRKAKCPACGQPVLLPAAPPAAVPATGTPPAGEEEKDCPRCMATAPAAQVICVSCGFDFRTGKYVKKPAPPAASPPAGSGAAAASGEKK